MELFGLPDPSISDFKIYWPNALTGAGSFIQWEIWYKPRGYSFLTVVAVGGGGQGGAGFAAGAGSAAGGGGGGGSGGYTSATFPMFLIPDRLYVLAGHGGNPSFNAEQSRVATYNTNTPQNTLIAAGEGSNGSNGSNSGAAGGGSPGGSVPQSSFPIGHWAIMFKSISGQTGAAGGNATGAAGSDITGPTGTNIWAGAGGGGKTSADFKGGDQLSIANTQIFGLPGGAAGSNPGSDAQWPPARYPIVYGGSGGGASNSTVGGRGGRGAKPGGGGAGGGAGVGTGGAGGTGGDGVVIMAAW